jgi:hypothetical protein
MSERIDKSGKRAAESEAHSRPPKKSAAASPAPKKRLLRQRPPAPKREVSSESSSDSYTRSFAPPGTPNSDDDFEGTEVDKLGAGRSKRKKFEGSLERAIAAKDLQKRGEQALAAVKARRDAVEKASREVSRSAPPKCSREAAERASREGFRYVPDRVAEKKFRDPPDRVPERRFRDPPVKVPLQPVRDDIRMASPKPIEDAPQENAEKRFPESPSNPIRGAPSPQLPRTDRLLTRGARLARAEAMAKDLAAQVRMHEEEAATQFSLSLPPTPPPRASRPVLFELLTYGLVESKGFERLKEVDEGVFLNELIHLIGQGDSHHSFLRALGAWMTRDVSTEDDVGDGNGHSLAAMKELCHEAKRVPRDISFWSKTIHSTWTYMKNSRKWDEYEVQSKAVCDAIFEKRKAYMREQVADYEHSV